MHDEAPTEKALTYLPQSIYVTDYACALCLYSSYMTTPWALQSAHTIIPAACVACLPDCHKHLGLLPAYHLTCLVHSLSATRAGRSMPTGNAQHPTWARKPAALVAAISSCSWQLRLPQELLMFVDAKRMLGRLSGPARCTLNQASVSSQFGHVLTQPNYGKCGAWRHPCMLYKKVH